MFEFGDAENPVNIPFDYAVLYDVTCDHPCPPEQDRWDDAHKRWITFSGNKGASIIDFEPGTEAYRDPDHVSSWLAEREADHDIHRPSWLYCDLANAEAATDAAKGHSFLWFIATLDGIRRSRQELSALLLDWHVPLRLTNPSLIAANQWRKGTGYDQSSCFGGWNG